MPLSQFYDSTPRRVLNTGMRIPAIGLGVWTGDTEEIRAAAVEWILTALNVGYRHLDTAWLYGTEKSVGEAIRRSGIPREEIFVTTKFPWHRPGEVLQCLDESLANAGLDYFDLYLIHWPQVVDTPDGFLQRGCTGRAKLHPNPPTLNDTWFEMEKALDTGKVKAIGVSNFSIKLLEQLFKTARVVPAVNQVELHPYLAQTNLVRYCNEKGIIISAYTPTGYDRVRHDPTVIGVANKYGVTPTQVILGWHLIRGNVVIPSSRNMERQKENLQPIILDERDMEVLNGLDRDEMVYCQMDEHGEVFGWSLERLGWDGPR